MIKGFEGKLYKERLRELGVCIQLAEKVIKGWVGGTG